MTIQGLRPFWLYYGGKWRAAPRYPAPRHPVIVEPFAGAAGYSCRYPDRRVVLIDRYPVIVGIWRYLIGVKASEVRAIPLVDALEDLPAWVPQEARDLIGFNLNSATVSPVRTLSAGARRLNARGRDYGWTESRRERVASQVDRIRHWTVREGSYQDLGNSEVTWFVDPPYNNKAGSYYVHGSRGVDFADIGRWCRARQGQTIVCENEGADWLPFRRFECRARGMHKDSSEAIWTNDPALD